MKTSKLQSKIENWEIKRLGEVAEYINGRAFKPSEWEARGLPIIRIQNLTESSSVFNYFAGDLEEKYRVENGDVLLSWSASLGVYIWNKGSAALNQHIFKVIPEETSVTKKYLFFVLQTVIDQIQKKVHGSTMKHITKPVFERIKISVPPLEIQQEIVKRLDAIRKAQELNDEQIALAEELFQSLLHQELDPQGKNWEVKRLSEVCEVNPSTILNQSNGTTVKYVEMAAIDENSKEIKYFLDRPINRVSSGIPKFMDNDVIFARITPCTENGKVAFVENCEGVCAGSTELHVLRANQEELLPRFLFYFLIKPTVKNMAVASMSGTTGRQRVPAEFFHYLKIPIPPLETQRQIVQKLQAAQDYKKSLLTQKQKLQELFESVLDKSMTP